MATFMPNPRRGILAGLRSSLQSMLQKSYSVADTEVRIAAYAGLMRCPDQPLVKAISDMLLKEQVNQGQVT
jgi:hypothetical protein